MAEPLWQTCSAARKIGFYLYLVLYWIQPCNHWPFQQTAKQIKVQKVILSVLKLQDRVIEQLRLGKTSKWSNQSCNGPQSCNQTRFINAFAWLGHFLIWQAFAFSKYHRILKKTHNAF